MASVGDGKVEPRLGSLQLSSKAPGASGLSATGLTEMELFSDGYSPLPEDLCMFKLDPGIKLWMKWNTKQELTNVGVPRRRPVGTDVYALAKSSDVDLTFAMKNKKKISTMRAKRENISVGGSSGVSQSEGGAGDETSRTSRTTATAMTTAVSVAGTHAGGLPLVSPMSLPNSSPVNKLLPIGEKPSRLASPLNPTFARRGLAMVARDEVSNVARMSAVAAMSGQDQLTPPATPGDHSGGARRIWGQAPTQLSMQAAAARLVPIAAFDKKAMPKGYEPPLEDIAQVLRTGRSDGMSTARSGVSRVSFAEPRSAAITPSFASPVRRLDPIRARDPDEPVRIQDYVPPPHKVIPDYEKSLPQEEARAVLRDPRLLDLEFFGALAAWCAWLWLMCVCYAPLDAH